VSNAASAGAAAKPRIAARRTLFHESMCIGSALTKMEWTKTLPVARGLSRGGGTAIEPGEDLRLKVGEVGRATLEPVVHFLRIETEVAVHEDIPEAAQSAEPCDERRG